MRDFGVVPLVVGKEGFRPICGRLGDRGQEGGRGGPTAHGLQRAYVVRPSGIEVSSDDRG